MNYRVHLDGANSLLLNYIIPNSTILEFGPATGEMTRFLQESLHCNVYIVEKNKEAFRQAINYAKHGICDDILSFSWVKEYSHIKFDFILFSNVLEHISQPDQVLKEAYNLLSDSGVLLISIPNIAHNDILLNLYESKFNYTENGLLDQTHIHFWGYQNLIPFFDSCGYKIVDIQAANIRTLETEQGESLVPYNLSLYELLKARNLGEVYQFVIALQKTCAPLSILGKGTLNISNDVHSTVYLDYGNGFSEANTIPMPLRQTQDNEFSLECVIKCPSNIHALRFDPLDGDYCIVQNLHIISNIGELRISHTNAFDSNGSYYFCNTDSQIFLEGNLTNVLWIKFQANIISLKSFQAQKLLTQLIQQFGLNKELSAQYSDLKSKFDSEHIQIEAAQQEFTSSWKTAYNTLIDYCQSNVNIGKKISLSQQDINKILGILAQLPVDLTMLKNSMTEKIDILQGNLENTSYSLFEALEQKKQILNNTARILQERENIDAQNSTLIANQAQQIDEQVNYIRSLENYIDSLKNSTCWRITKPLRFIGNIKNSFLCAPQNTLEAEEKCIFHLEHYSLDNYTLKVSGWVASKNVIDENAKINFIGKQNNKLMGALPLHFTERNDVISVLSERYPFAKGISIEASIRTNSELNVSLIFTSGGLTYAFPLEVISAMPNVSSFQCLVSSQNRGSAELGCLTALFGTRDSGGTENIYKEIFDIIIPIYNGYEYFCELFNSIEKTNCHYRLILINDCSPDKRVKEFISAYSSTHKDVIVIDNPENLGFVQSVNKGLELSRNHVVLLNTDVVLPTEWLERLMLPILNNSQIATTTPFTNSGTICSFPFFGKDNPIDNQFTVDAIDSYFKKLLPNYTIIPTGVGFCMGINKNALKKVGLLDAKTFSKGYGEENDWCQRAISFGYYNIHINNLFVYHKHGGSFLSSEKRALLERNSKLLNQKHPNYPSDVAIFCSLDPMRETREAVHALLILLEYPGENILAFNHDLGGGATSYLNKKKQRVLENGNKLILIKYNVHSSSYIIHMLYKNYELKFKATKYADIHEFIMTMPISEIWINELVSYPNLYETLNGLIEVKKEKKRNITLTMLLHDLFFICPAINMINDKGEFCNFPQINKCELCAKNNSRTYCSDFGTIKKFRSEWETFLQNCDQIIAFSENTARFLKKIYGPQNTLKVVPHQIDFLPALEKKCKTTPTFNIGILGVLNYHKGYQIIKDMLYLIEKNNLNIKIILIGYSEEPIISRHFYETGRYSRESLPKLVSMLDIDIFFISSIWPETFSYTTAEIMSLNYPVASFNIGAPADRIAKYDKGLIIKTMTAANALSSLYNYYNKTLNINLSSRKVLFVIEETSFASRYRVEHVQEKLSYRGISSDIVMISEIDTVFLPQYEKVIVYRVSDYKSIAGLKLQTEKLSIPLQYDIDDFIFDYKQICYLPFLHQEEYWDFESYCNNIQKTMVLCNSYTVSTETLKTAILAFPLFSGKNVTVRRNMASMEMFCLSDLAYANKEMLKNDASQIWLGYFSGSKTHDGDFDVISDVILQLMEQYSNLYLKIGGCLKLPDAFKKYQERIFNFPFKDWRELPREIASVDINLMPLEPTFFNQCKSENKWMEAGLVRVPTVASYNDELALVINGKNGLLCNSMQEWYDNLSYLIEEPKARKAIGEEAYLRIMTSYTTLSLNNRKGCVN